MEADGESCSSSGDARWGSNETFDVGFPMLRVLSDIVVVTPVAGFTSAVNMIQAGQQ